MAKRIVIPFATSGDKSVTPNATDPTGAVSWSQGWGPDYQRDNTDPLYKPVGRQEMNGIMFDLSDAISELQAQGFPTWVQPAGLIPPYAINAYVRYNDLVWRSTVANNSAIPGANANWVTVIVQTTITTGGTAAALTLAPNPAITAYATGQRFPVRFSAATTPSSTINVSGLGVKNLKQYDSTGAKIPAVTAAGQISDIEYDGTDWVVLSQLPPSNQRRQSIRGLAFKSRASANGSSTNVSFVSDGVIVADAAGNCLTVDTISHTMNTALVASATVDGMASGPTAINTWYGVYLWYNSTTGVKRLTGDSARTTGAAPVAPAAGFDMWAQVSEFKTDGTVNKYPLNFIQTDKNFQWKVGGNVAGSIKMISGVQGNPVTPTWAVVPWGAYFPPSVAAIFVSLYNQGAATQTVFAPSNAYGPVNSATNMPMINISNSAANSNQNNFSVRVVPESDSVYYASNATVSHLSALGWEGDF